MGDVYKLREKGPSLIERDLKAEMLYRAWYRATQIPGRPRREFSIGREDLSFPEICPLLGVKIDYHDPESEFGPSIDRIDNSLGYIPGNVQVISKKANSQKNKLPMDIACRWLPFWELYPRKVARKSAKAAWMKLSESDQIAALLALPKHINNWKDQQYIPHASTWINQARWEDVIPIKSETCRWPGCGYLTEDSYCIKHQEAVAKGETPCR